MIDILNRLYADNIDAKDTAIGAVNAALGSSLIIKQKSYRTSTLIKNWENFSKYPA